MIRLVAVYLHSPINLLAQDKAHELVRIGCLTKGKLEISPL
jgi:hypothetical protein